MPKGDLVKCPGRCGQMIRNDLGHACPPVGQVGSIEVLSNAGTRVAVVEVDGKITYEIGAFKLEERVGISVALAILADAAKRTGSLEATVLHKLLGRSIAEMF